MIEQHIAAANGNEHCVILLLEYGANPSIEGIITNSRIYILISPKKIGWWYPHGFRFLPR